MKLTIITINRNNAEGLEKTMQSVSGQTFSDFEYIVIDGASTDNSRDVIRRHAESFGERINWVSEPDNGIYNAMNKGIGMATGDYVQFLNSGDCLAASDVMTGMLDALSQHGYPPILYGNMIKAFPDGRRIRDYSFAGREMTFLDFYRGTLNHSSAFIRRELFRRYGFYDESLKIVSDWKWFLQAIILGDEKPVYTDIDVTVFDMTGISESNSVLAKDERKQVLHELIPSTVLADYECWASPIDQMKRFQRHPWASKLFYFIERGLFKIEKSQNNRKGIQ